VEIVPFIPVAVVGLPGVGKSSIIESLAGEYNSHDPPTETAGVSQRTIELHGRAYLFYDVCGYTSHSNEWIECISQSRAVICVLDPKMLAEAPIHVQSLYRTIGPAIVQRHLPTLTLVNKYRPAVDLAPLEQLMNTTFIDCPMHLATVTNLNQTLLAEFEWIESLVA
jgi:GTPase SAR1 family protein